MVSHAVSSPLILTNPAPHEFTLCTLHVHAAPSTLRWNSAWWTRFCGKAQGTTSSVSPLSCSSSVLTDIVTCRPVSASSSFWTVFARHYDSLVVATSQVPSFQTLSAKDVAAAMQASYFITTFLHWNNPHSTVRLGTKHSSHVKEVFLSCKPLESVVLRETKCFQCNQWSTQ